MPKWNMTDRTRETYDHLARSRAFLHERLESIGRSATGRQDVMELLGLDPGKTFEVHSLRPARRASPDGKSLTDLVIEITQARPGYFDEGAQKRVDKNGRRVVSASWLEESESELLAPAKNGKKAAMIPRPDFIFRGGCTLVVDLNTSQVRYSVYKDINSDSRLARQRSFESGQTGSVSNGLRTTYFSGQIRHEPFALLHRSGQAEEIEWLS